MHPILFSGPMVRAILDDRKTQTRRHDYIEAHARLEGILDTCPYGNRGDRLWVRETWQAWSECDLVSAEALHADARLRLNYPADGNTWKARLRPSIHMPRWASRITLEIVDVRAERVRDISGQDALAEGVTLPTMLNGPADPVVAFAELWDSINEKRGQGWAVNPFVWVISFRRII